MRLFAVAVAIGLSAFAQDQAQFPRTALVVVLDDNYPPYVFRDADGRLQGILPDQWALWQKKTGVRVELNAMDWAKAKQVMQDGQADVIDTFFRTPEREQIYDFTPPYAQIDVPVFAHESLGGLADVSSLKGFTVGVKAGDAVVEQLTNQGILSLKEYPNYEAIVQAAKSQEIKVFSIDQPAAIYYLYKYGIESEFRRSFVLYTGEFHRAVRKNRPELLNLVNGGFKKISPREYRAIDQKWMGTPFLLRETLRDCLPILFLIAGVISMLAVGNLVLRNRVRARTAELRQALEKLRHSQSRLQSILKVAPVGIGVLSHRKFVEINDTLCNLSGYSREEVIGRSSRAFYATQEEFDRVGETLYPLIARDGFGTMEIHGRQKSGKAVRWWLSGAPLDPLRPEDGIIFAIMDITERQKAEEELRISREYFASVFNSINDGLHIFDAQTGRLLDVNQRMCEMFGYSREESLAGGIGLVSAGTPPYTAQDGLIWLRKAYTDGPQVFEWLAKHHDGYLFWVEINICRVRIGSDDRMIVTVRDITERKHAVEERLRYERQIQEAQKLESLGTLAGGIAHDFNNLLTAILGNIELALLDIPRNSAARSDLLTAVTGTQRAAELAQQMLAYSGKGRFVVEWVEVPSAIQEIAQMMKASISKSAELRMHFPEGLPPIEVDASQLRQVIMNLVVNASEALENRSGMIDISVGVLDGQRLSATQLQPHEPLPPGPYLYIEVADTGMGIPSEQVDRIFDPFYSTKFTGRGLGLPTVLGIVRGHKGAIQVTSAPGKGTTFRVFFPAKLHPQCAISATPVPAAAARTASGMILLVDDEPGVRDTASKLLARLGYQVLCAADGAQAIHLFRNQAPRVSGILLDLTMPHLDGVQTLAEIRRIRADVPVIISSGYSETDVLQRFEGLKVNGFIPKPYTLEGLRATLAKHLSA
jgi:PAS domain S-box-containing protein